MSTSNDIDTLLRQSAEALENRRYAEAEVSQTRVINLLHRAETGDPRLARALETLAGIHFVQGKFELAANEYQEALRLNEVEASNDDQTMWRVLYWLGLSHFKNQNYDAAEISFRRALSLADRLNDNSDSLATSLYRLGFHLYFVGKYQQAEPYLLRALPLYEKTKGVGDIDTVEVLTRIALTYEHCPEIGKDPEPYLREAVESTKPEGETYEVHVENLCRLAEHVAGRGRFEEADGLFSRLLGLLKSAVSDNSPSHWVISDCVKYFKSRDKAEVVKEFAASEQSYDAYGEITQNRLRHAEQTLSEHDPEFAEALFASANNLIFTGKYEQAEMQLRRALDFYQKIHGDKSLQTVTALNRLCVVTRLLKKPDEAEEAIGRALAIAEESFSDQNVYAMTLENLALLREAESKTDEATNIYARAIAEMERICGFPSYEAVEALYRQSSHLFRAGEFNLAEGAIRRAISAMDGVDELSSYEKSDYFSTLATILEALERGTEAAEMRKRARELFEQGELENAPEN